MKMSYIITVLFLIVMQLYTVADYQCTLIVKLLISNFTKHAIIHLMCCVYFMMINDDYVITLYIGIRKYQNQFIIYIKCTIICHTQVNFRINTLLVFKIFLFDDIYYD